MDDGEEEPSRRPWWVREDRELSVEAHARQTGSGEQKIGRYLRTITQKAITVTCALCGADSWREQYPPGHDHATVVTPVAGTPRLKPLPRGCAGCAPAAAGPLRLLDACAGSGADLTCVGRSAHPPAKSTVRPPQPPQSAEFSMRPERAAQDASSRVSPDAAPDRSSGVG